MYSKCGECKNCGAPMYTPTVWMGIFPPQPVASCACAVHAARKTTTINTFGTSGLA